MPPYRVADQRGSTKYPSGGRCQHRSPVAGRRPRVPAVRLAAAGPSWMPVAAPGDVHLCRRNPREAPPPDGLGLIAVSTGAIVAAAACPHIAWADRTADRRHPALLGWHRSRRRGRSQTTVTPPRRPASITASTGPAFAHVAAPSSRRARVPARSRQCAPPDQFSRHPGARSGQRRPGRFRRSPEDRCRRPHGSRSTNSASAAACARATANNDAPAPPRPPMTATTAPQIPSSRADSAASATRPDQFTLLLRASSSTCWAPTIMAAAQVAVAASVPVLR